MERKIKVKIDTLSDEFHIDLGVRLGFVLGPLLFLLAINDLLDSVSVRSLVLFADDGSLSIPSDTSEELLFGVDQVITQMTS